MEFMSRVDSTFPGNYNGALLIGLDFCIGYSCLILDFKWKHGRHITEPKERV
jgi:hypothetical protein